MAHNIPSSKDPEKRMQLLSDLKSIQIHQGRITSADVLKMATEYHLSTAEVYGVASFYSFLSTDQKETVVIRVCQCLPCELKGSPALYRHLAGLVDLAKKKSNKKYSLELVNCIGACDQAPALMINDELHGDMTIEKLTKLFEQGFH